MGLLDNQELWDQDAAELERALCVRPSTATARRSAVPPVNDVLHPRLHRTPVAGGRSHPGPVAGADGPRRCPDRGAGRCPDQRRCRPSRWTSWARERHRSISGSAHVAARREGDRRDGDRGHPGAAPPRAARAGLGRPGPARRPGRLFAIGEINDQALFPRVAAVAHHGGADNARRRPRRPAHLSWWCPRVRTRCTGRAGSSGRRRRRIRRPVGELRGAVSRARGDADPRDLHAGRKCWPARSAPTGRWLRCDCCCWTRSANAVTSPGPRRRCPSSPPSAVRQRRRRRARCRVPRSRGRPGTTRWCAARRPPSALSPAARRASVGE